MGKGDQKSRRGKINAGSYGKRRPRKTAKATPVATEKVAKAPKEDLEKKETKPKATKPKATKEAPATDKATSKKATKKTEE